ncbi:chemotaxis protein CheB [Leptolyngbya sp. PCC 6406]|uniref:chemotaxis protein CheB n=1 Tax=Leptolyngbya sp. PCC 6406 TaxID=1173264 RepID=UPI0002ABC677|nr:chemotaxis protein CheB [Leptolyngbya sp. PCC 6406]
MPESDTSGKATTPQSSEPSTTLFPIVGIGASAGGLEAFTQLLSHLPNDTGMGFVLVQHLDPSHDSFLSEILARTTSMPVGDAQDGMAIAPNHVYVIPPNTTMTLEGGKLHLVPRVKVHGTSKTIDTFFESLAMDRHNKAIGVVLSGGDSDGTLGLEAIKAAGGITFAQTETSAQVRSMPSQAIATGQVDFVLLPEEIAQELAKISHHPYVSTAKPENLASTSSSEQEVFSMILGLLKTATRVDFQHYKPTTLRRRIFRRMALYRLQHLEDYGRYLRKHPEEVQALHQEILIHVTSFFRDEEAFAALKRHVFPAIAKNRSPQTPIRIWVAGCSTGEEAYSIAISLLEFLRHRTDAPGIQIFATDVSDSAIEFARLGVYSHNKVANVSPDQLKQFFVPVENGYKVQTNVRELCIFARQDLISDPPFSNLDLISCRNVLIYFGSTLQGQVLPMFHYGLKPTGFLLLGTSESVGEFSDQFAVVESKQKLYTKQYSSRPLNMNFIASSEPPRFATPQVNRSKGKASDRALYETADQVALAHYGSVGVVVNPHYDIVQFRGQTGAYLEPAPGRASLNLIKMAKESLRLELQTALHQAKQTDQTVSKMDIPLREEEIQSSDAPMGIRHIRLDVIPFQPAGIQEKYFLVLFKTQITVSPDQKNGVDLDPKQAQLSRADRSEVQRLQQELATTSEHLQAIIEEQEATNQDFRVANEEVLSSNEELQSTNEELQTAKEEVQATNEELSTINEELYRRNAEATLINNDFQNLLSGISIPILILDRGLRIRRFTPVAGIIFNLIDSDIDRPFSNINHTLKIGDLEQKITTVIDTLAVSNQTVQSQGGHWYDLRIRPYLTVDNRMDGAVVVLVDIDALERSRKELEAARNYAEAIVQTVREALVVLNSDLHVVTANQKFYDLFQVAPSQTENRSILELGNGQWNNPQFRALLEDILPHHQQIKDFEIIHDFEQIGPRTLLLNASEMIQGEGQRLILLAIEDISDPQS